MDDDIILDTESPAAVSAPAAAPAPSMMNRLKKMTAAASVAEGDKKSKKSRQGKKKSSSSSLLFGETEIAPVSSMRNEFAKERKMILKGQMPVADRMRLLEESKREEAELEQWELKQAQEKQALALEHGEDAIVDSEDEDAIEEEMMDSEDERFNQAAEEADADESLIKRRGKDHRRIQKLNIEEADHEDRNGVSGAMAQLLKANGSANETLIAANHRLAEDLASGSTSWLKLIENETQRKHYSASIKAMLAGLYSLLNLDTHSDVTYEGLFGRLENAGRRMGRICRHWQTVQSARVQAQFSDEMRQWAELVKPWALFWLQVLPKYYPKEGEVPMREARTIGTIGTTFARPVTATAQGRAIGGGSVYRPGQKIWEMLGTDNNTHVVALPDMLMEFYGMAFLYMFPASANTVFSLVVAEMDARRPKAKWVYREIVQRQDAFNVLKNAIDVAANISIFYELMTELKEKQT